MFIGKHPLLLLLIVLHQKHSVLQFALKLKLGGSHAHAHTSEGTELLDHNLGGERAEWGWRVLAVLLGKRQWPWTAERVTWGKEILEKILLSSHISCQCINIPHTLGQVLTEELPGCMEPVVHVLPYLIATKSQCKMRKEGAKNCRQWRHNLSHPSS